MGSSKLITIEELQKGNKRMCLSALRVFDKCDECEVMKRYYADQTRKLSLRLKPCESAMFSKERLSYLQEKKEIQGKINQLTNQLNKLKGMV